MSQTSQTNESLIYFKATLIKLRKNHIGEDLLSPCKYLQILESQNQTIIPLKVLWNYSNERSFVAFLKITRKKNPHSNVIPSKTLFSKLFNHIMTWENSPAARIRFSHRAFLQTTDTINDQYIYIMSCYIKITCISWLILMVMARHRTGYLRIFSSHVCGDKTGCFGPKCDGMC